MEFLFHSSNIILDFMDKYSIYRLYDWFWTESFWLPVGYTWDDFKSTPNIQKAEVSDLHVLPLLVILVLLFRYCFEKYLAKPFCIFIGIKNNSKFVANRNCEKRYINGTRYPSNEELNDLVNETKMTKQEICTWFRRRRKTNNSLLAKSTECCWRCVMYLISFLYGSFILLKTDWIWDNSTWLDNYIHGHELTVEIKWYYFLELSFYISLFISQFFDTKRKDFYQLFIHHIATIVLLLGSYITSLYRCGVIIAYLHDAADYWLEAAKVANYAKIQKICDVLFGIFAIVFFATCLVYYPMFVAYGYFKYNTNTNSVFQNSMVSLCFVLLFLHFYWGFLIARMVFKLVVAGKVEKDTRSDSEESENEE